MDPKTFATHALDRQAHVRSQPPARGKVPRHVTKCAKLLGQTDEPLKEKKAYFIFLSFVVSLILILAEADTFKGCNGDQSQALTAQERRGGGRDRIQASHPEVDTNNVVDPNHTDSSNT